MTTDLSDLFNPFDVIRRIAEGTVTNAQAACERWLKEHEQNVLVVDTSADDVFVLRVPDLPPGAAYGVLREVLEMQFGLDEEHLLYPTLDVDKFGRLIEESATPET